MIFRMVVLLKQHNTRLSIDVPMFGKASRNTDSTDCKSRLDRVWILESLYDLTSRWAYQHRTTHLKSSDTELIPEAYQRLYVRRGPVATMTSSGVPINKGNSYQSQQHGPTVVAGFQRLWQECQMCDTRLIVQGQSFQVHRAYLAACSNYFYSMFTEGFQEQDQKTVELKGVTAPGLRAVLDYAYTGKIVINDNNLQDVLEAAAHLQFTEVLTFCSQYMNDELTIENCLQILHMGEVYGLAECKREAKRFILENFVPVSENEEFRNVSPDLFCEFLADDKLQAHSELEVFKVALHYLEGREEDDRKRAELAKKIMALIRFGLMNTEQMEYVYSNELMLSQPCHEVLQAALNYHLKLFCQPVLKTTTSQMRAYQDSLVVFGAGYLDNTLCSQMLAARMHQDKLKPFVNLSSSKERRYFAAVAVVNNFVYVVGGQTAMAGDGSHATSTVFRYNPRDSKWLQVSSMMVPRTHFALIATPTFLIAVGGKHNRMALSSCEKYDFTTNDWAPITSLPNTLFSHAGCCHGNKVFVSGGCPGDDFTNEMHCYDLDRGGWQIKAPMRQSRGYHVMVTHSNKLFVCAGNTNAGDRRDVKMTECYDVELDQWSVLSSASQGQSEAPAVKYGHRIYILGGYSWDAQSFQDTIQCYDLEANSWSVLDTKLPEPMTGVVACYLKLPQAMYHDHLASDC